MHRIWPSVEYEARLWAEGYRRVAGVDEAGRGAWAGPVVAAAVVLPPGDPDLAAHLLGVCDSKQLSAHQREVALEAVLRVALAWGVGTVSSRQIDRIGIVPSTRRAMVVALDGLRPPAEALLIDHLALPEVAVPQVSLPKGDVRVLSIAAASILAKVYRDRLMANLDAQYPGYGFARHKGYGTPQHVAALASLGPCGVHRVSFAPLRAQAQEL